MKILMIGIIVFAIVIFLFSFTNINMKTVDVKIGNKTILKDVEIADNYLTLTKGLMFRTETNGMILVFPKEGKHDIWMMFMFMPLDLVFLDSNKKVVDIKRDVKPLTFYPGTWKLYRPKKNAKYCLEVNPGIDVKVGDILSF